MKRFIFIQFAALVAVCVTQECKWGACYPQMGEVQMSKEIDFKASSTCGLNGIEVYCTPLPQLRMKCCPCDSRNPEGRNAHTITNVLSAAGPERWWQSKKDVNPVTIELDLKHLFQLETLLLHFKGPRPDALVIERSADFGRSWTPALYMATDCKTAFPHVSIETTYDLNVAHCYTLPSNTNNLYLDQRVYFHPLLQFSNLNIPQEEKIEKLSGYTGLRVNLTQFGAVPYIPGRHPSRFYALKEIKVIGSCFCHGHAQRCLPDPASNYISSTQVSEVCECQHNTAGLNCERCADLYNDLPWHLAEKDNTHTCKRCECNNHAERCYFDPELFERTGRRSGGVCEQCMHHTTGVHCEHCANNYYRNPRSSIQHADACLRCLCDSAGSEGCDEVTGACRCKINAEGPRCDHCKPGYYSLSITNPLGCSKCSCSATGALHSQCDDVTGQCVCRPNMKGRTCDQCAEGYWKSPSGCQRCNCDITNAINNACGQITGQCSCRPGFGGRTCSGCPENMYGDAITGCKTCSCNRLGSVSEGCDRLTGVCVCRDGVTGVRCDRCSRGRCGRFPHCPVCPSCFFSLDTEIQNLTLWLSYLKLKPLTPTDFRDILRRISHAQDTLRQVTYLIRQLPNHQDLYSSDLQWYNSLSSRLAKLLDDLKGAGVPPPNLEQELNKLQSELSNIQFVYNAKKQAASNFDNSNNAGALAAVKDAYNRSVDALKRVEATSMLVNESAFIRDNVIKNLKNIQPNNTKNLQSLTEFLATQPNLTPAAVQVCGSKRVMPCTPQKCDGKLCSTEGELPCGTAMPCTGALRWSNRAIQDSADVKNKLQQLNKKITQTYKQIPQSQYLANQIRLDTDKLFNRVKDQRDDIDEKLKDIKDFVQRLKDFLSDPSSDPEVVQRVCEGVLDVKLPETVDTLKKKLKEIQDVAASLPESTTVLQNAELQLQQAEQLLHDAERARDAALGLQDDVDGFLGSINENENALDDMKEKLQKSLNIINSTNQDITSVEKIVQPTEDLVNEVSELVEALRPLLDSLDEELRRGKDLAKDAIEQADGANRKAYTAEQDLLLLQNQLSKLKQSANVTKQNDSAGKLLQLLQNEATTLIQDTADIMKQLTGKEASLQGAKAEAIMHAARLNGLESYLQKLLADIRAKATQLSMCQA